MEAKDTVIKTGKIIDYFLKALEMLETQAEITRDKAFKAGEGKVVEWLETHPHILNPYHTEEWQEFLKSEGIE